MARRTRILVTSVAAVVLMAGLIALAFRITFERRIARETDELLAASRGGAPRIVTEADLTALPEPVRRWLRWAQVVGKPIPATVRLSQEGQFRLGPERGWLLFTAEEVFTTDPPGFLWWTRMQMFPGVAIVGRDRYVHGAGSIEMRLLGVVPVANASGPHLNQGALLRYLNETMWIPAAVLLPAITWEAAGPDAATATITHGGIKAAATFHFDAEGRPVDMRAERFDMGTGTIQSWSTPLRAWGEFAGVRMPTEGSGVWRYPGGDFAYIDMRITGISYDG